MSAVEKINNDLFKNIPDPEKQVMEGSGVQKTQVDDIVLVEGPVAYSATVQSGISSGKGGQDMLLLSVTPNIRVTVRDTHLLASPIGATGSAPLHERRGRPF